MAAAGRPRLRAVGVIVTKLSGRGDGAASNPVPLNIAPENLTRIFAHGFTTRAGGHGFGLHSCALATKVMGGTLTAHSAGQGRGATFTLELPVQVAAHGATA